MSIVFEDIFEAEEWQFILVCIFLPDHKSFINKIVTVSDKWRSKGGNGLRGGGGIWNDSLIGVQ